MRVHCSLLGLDFPFLNTSNTYHASVIGCLVQDGGEQMSRRFSSGRRRSGCQKRGTGVEDGDALAGDRVHCGHACAVLEWWAASSPLCALQADACNLQSSRRPSQCRPRRRSSKSTWHCGRLCTFVHATIVRLSCGLAPVLLLRCVLTVSCRRLPP